MRRVLGPESRRGGIGVLSQGTNQIVSRPVLMVKQKSDDPTKV
jgi:hypothetical protein